jgi:ParB family chromosome partitioning protein
MATAVQKITLAPSRDIPFNKLVLSQSNVRRIKAGVSVEELADSIARRGLIQSISVFPVVDPDGNETGMFEVPAGGRRYRALELLVKRKRLAKTAPVPCVVRERDGAILPEEISLSENIERAALHPLDQYRAFQDMRDKGMSEEEVAAAFFVSVAIVKQRLRLTAVSPTLLQIYADDGMQLEHVMAFTVSNDHARQEQVWDAIKDGWNKQPYQIRRMLTESAVRASDKRALYVGIDAYEEAGGFVLRDLFEEDDGGWLQDPSLLDMLVAEKLRDAAVGIAAEGWKWIEVGVSFPYDATYGLRELAGETIALTPDEEATIAALNAEYEQIEAQHEGADELPDEVDHRLGEIETALGAFETRPVRYDSADIARAGVFVSIGHDGSIDIDRGYVRAADEAPIVQEDGKPDTHDPANDGADEASNTQTVIAIAGQTVEPAEDEDGIKPLPDRLLGELTAHRTLALRNAVANDPRVAMTALLHKLVADAFDHHSYAGALDVSVRHVHFPAQDEALGDSAAAREAEQRHELWGDIIPADDDARWDWIDRLDDTDRMALLAHCVSFGVNALYEKPNPYGGHGVSQHGLDQRLAQADRLARATGLDMVSSGWRPTVGNYLGRVTKARILLAVREGAGDTAAQTIDHLKKGEMAKQAEELLARTGWLAEPLRLTAPATIGDDSAEDGGEQAMGDSEPMSQTDPSDDAPFAVAAE